MEIMETTLKGTVRYLGTDFSGWQVQDRTRTVQGELEGALSRIAAQTVKVQGAGRTDSGVHALGQVFSCVWPGAYPERLRHALSKMLGPEIRVTSLEAVSSDFSARFSAVSKRYVYTLDLGREADPLTSLFAWHVPYLLDLDLMEGLLPLLAGEHDFSGFQSTGTQMEKTVRTLFEVRLERGGMVEALGENALWRLTFHGDGFLYKMVRNLTGTLVEIGRGRFEAGFLQESLESGGPFKGHCAPAHGLSLVEVFYE